MPLPDLHRFDLWALARSAAHAEAYSEGRLTLADLPRLFAEKAPNSAMEAEFTWSLTVFHETRLGQTKPTLLMNLTLKAEIWLVCQRCLEAYLQPLSLSTTFEIVQTQEQADTAPIDDDEIDVVVGSHHFDLFDLIEEELLLALPLVPRHAICAHPALARLREEFAAFDEVKASPFAALADLSVKKH